jgi:hypothetical protein
MEIHTLKLSVGEDEINALLAENPSEGGTVENLRVRLTPEGIVILGDYPTMFMKVGFETLWEVRAAGGLVEARLATVKVSGLPARLLRGVLLKTIRDLIADKPGLEVENEFLRMDLGKLSASRQFPLRVNLTGVKCGPGRLVIEAGPETA